LLVVAIVLSIAVDKLKDNSSTMISVPNWAEAVPATILILAESGVRFDR